MRTHDSPRPLFPRAARHVRLAVALGALGAVAARAGGWDDRFNVRGVERDVHALASDGTYIYAAGVFETAGSTAASRIARWDGTRWSPLGSGMDGEVDALLWDGLALYAGGGFRKAGGVPANGIARWDGTTWSPVGTGIGGSVFALVSKGSELYAGGFFRTAGGSAASNVARWSGSSWSPLGSGVDEMVLALASDGSNLYAGGDFTIAGGTSAKHVAQWDGTRWSPLSSGVSGFGSVYALAWDGASLVAGGGFTTAGGVSANYVARWDGAAWSAVGTGTNGRVYALAWDGAILYVGGDFARAGGALAAYVAQWDGTAWNPLDSGTDSHVYALAHDGSNLHAGGQFTTAGGAPASHLAQWNGTAWSALPPDGEGLTSVQGSGVACIARAGSSSYVGGLFTIAGGVAASSVALWDGASWTSLGAGTNRVVRAAIWDGSSLYIGGEFSGVGGIPAQGVARWDGTTWSSLGAGTNGYVYSLAWDGASLYAGGWFTSAGGASARYIGRWDGITWSALGTGMDGFVYALEWDGSGLYAGGNFTKAGAASADNVARWSGTPWVPVGGGTNSVVYALESSGPYLYAAGAFTMAGTVPAGRVARWDGVSWSALGSGADANIYTLASDASSLYAGGGFATMGGVVSNGIACWNGRSWSGLGSGVNGGVSALAWDGSGLQVGGYFSTAGGRPSVGLARWICPTIAISPTSLPAATIGVPYVAAFVAAGGTVPYTFAITAGSSPPGLSLSPSGVLSGTPTTPGVFPFTITATDADTCTGDVDLVLLVNPASCPAITISPPALPDATLGDPYSQTLTATGGTFPYTFAVAAGALPGGIALAPSGALFGTPTEPGTFVFTAATTDAAGCLGMRTYALLVGSGTGNVIAGQGSGLPNPNRVKVFSGDGRPTGSDFLAYGAGTWGASAAAGDLGTDPRGADQIVTGPGPGPVLGPHVRTFLRDGTPVPKVSFYAYGTLRHGVNPGAAVLDADAFDEILTGAGAGVVFGPHVRAFDVDGGAAAAISKVSYFAYGTLRYGAGVHRGDVDADGFAEPLTGPGPGPYFGPQVRGWNYDGAVLTSIAGINFAAFAAVGYGVHVAGGTVDMDAYDELAAATGPGPSFTPEIAAFGYDGSQVAPLPGFAVTLSTTIRYGARAGLGDVNGDAVHELLAGKGPDPGADARVSRYGYAAASLGPLPWFDAFPGASYGVNAAGARTGY